MSFVYFIQAGGSTGAVKIGRSCDVAKRLNELKTGNHEPLAVLFAINCGDSETAALYERNFHSLFADLRLGRSEWFAWHQDLSSCIEMLRSVQRSARAGGFTARFEVRRNRDDGFVIAPAGFWTEPGEIDLKVSEHGFADSPSDDTVAPSPEHVQICCEWLRIHARKLYGLDRVDLVAGHDAGRLQIVPCDEGSYGLKHRVERWAKRYVTNGAFILAAHQEGYYIERAAPRSPNAIVALVIVRDENGEPCT